MLSVSSHMTFFNLTSTTVPLFVRISITYRLTVYVEQCYEYKDPVTSINQKRNDHGTFLKELEKL